MSDPKCSNLKDILKLLHTRAQCYKTFLSDFPTDLLDESTQKATKVISHTFLVYLAKMLTKSDKSAVKFEKMFTKQGQGLNSTNIKYLKKKSFFDPVFGYRYNNFGWFK